jgi:hypothetical protein
MHLDLMENDAAASNKISTPHDKREVGLSA